MQLRFDGIEEAANDQLQQGVLVLVQVREFGGDDLPALWSVQGLDFSIGGEPICSVQRATATHGLLRLRETRESGRKAGDGEERVQDFPTARSSDGVAVDEEGIFTGAGRKRAYPTVRVVQLLRALFATLPTRGARFRR